MWDHPNPQLSDTVAAVNRLRDWDRIDTVVTGDTYHHTVTVGSSDVAVYTCGTMRWVFGDYYLSATFENPPLRRELSRRQLDKRGIHMGD